MSNHASRPRVSMKRYLFFRLQLSFYTALAIFFAIGITAIHTLVNHAQAPMLLTCVFLVLGILLASWQVIINYSLLTKMLDPFQRMLGVIQNCVDDLDTNDRDKIHQNTIRKHVDEINKLLSKHPTSQSEFDEMNLLLSKLLNHLAKSIERSQSDFVLKTMGEVCSHVAHDMRSPIGIIYSFLGFIPKEYLHSKPKLLQFHQIAQSSCNRLIAMTDELLEYRKVWDIKFAPIDVAHLVRGVADAFALRSQKDKLSIQYRGPESLSSFGDKDKLERVLHNLINNAAQAMEDSDKQKVSISLSEKDSKIHLDIFDTGPGIPEKNLGKLFLPTFSTKGVKGNGLGLAYCRQVIESHHGTIEVSNHDEGGAHFHIELPQQSIN